MDYNVSFLGGNVVIVGGEVECFVQEVLADGWVELFDVEGRGCLLALQLILNKLKEDTDRIKNEPKLLIAADKTTNFYKLEPSTYNDLLEKKHHKILL